MTKKKDQSKQKDAPPETVPADAGVLKKLLHIQREVDGFVKDSQGHNYSYPSGNQILNKIRPLMNELGLLLKQEVTGKKHQIVTYVNSYGDEKAEMFCDTEQLMTWIDTDTAEEYSVRWSADGMNGWDKGLGSALTYGERYFLLKFFHVPTDADDPDTDQADKSGSTRSGNRPAPGDPPQTAAKEKEWLNRTEYKSDKLTEDWLEVAERVYGEPKELKKVYREWKVNKECRAELEKLAHKKVPKPPRPVPKTEGMTKEQLNEIDELTDYLNETRKAHLAAHIKKGISKDDADSIIKVLRLNKNLREEIYDCVQNGYPVPEEISTALDKAGNPAEYMKVKRRLEDFIREYEDKLGA